MRFSCLVLLATLFLLPAHQSLANDESTRISIPHGFSEFAVITNIKDDGRAISIYFPYAEGNALSFPTLDGAPPEIEVLAYTVHGKRLAPRQLAKLVSRNSIVLVTRDGKLPAKEYRKLLSDNLVVFVFKPNKRLVNIFLQHPQSAIWHLRIKSVIAK